MPGPLRRSPLHEWHLGHGARMVEFAGWRLPVQYRGIVEEHRAVRERAGLFDVSHMGEIRIRGRDALRLVQRLTVNDAGRLEVGAAHYTVMANDRGGIVDDLLVYRLGEDDYLLVVNAATTGSDLEWVRRHAAGRVAVEDESPRWAQLAVQGPGSMAVVSRVLDGRLRELPRYRSTWVPFAAAEALVSRTGYTGEDGYEVYLPPDRAVELAERLLGAGEAEGVVLAGLGARDTLRLEAGLLLYGRDMDESRTPVEAGLGWLVKPDKGEFIGREPLLRQLQEGPRQRLAGLVAAGRAIPRHGYPVVAPDGAGPVGEVTSGNFSPTLRRGIGLAYLPTPYAQAGTRLAVEVRGAPQPVEVVRLPFYRRRP